MAEPVKGSAFFNFFKSQAEGKSHLTECTFAEVYVLLEG